MRKHSILLLVSAIFLTTGITSVGFAVIQIHDMRVSSSGELPLGFTSPITSLNSTTNSIAYNPKRGDFIGTLSIPVLKKTFPIFEGTETSQLQKGVGHFEGSVLPGEIDNSVLAGHRDSVFSQLGKLNVGDKLIVSTTTGNYTYQVSRFRIVKAEDRTVIVPTTSAVLTLSTCYPFSFIGNAPKRFIVSAALIQTPKEFLALRS